MRQQFIVAPVFRRLGLFLLCGAALTVAVSACSIGDQVSADASVADVKTAEATQQSELPAASTASAAAWQCPNGHGCPCTADSDCGFSGLCLTSAAGTAACATPCPVGVCGDGSVCRSVTEGTAPGPWCVPKLARLCDPCASAKDCQQRGHPSAACISYGVVGNFCGVACQGDSDCGGAGFGCRPVASTDSGNVLQCVRLAGGEQGQCECSPRAIAEKSQTSCGIGTCKGARGCGESGLSLCDGATPTGEVCNGKDDDCDGATDQSSTGIALCDDGKACTADSCDPAAGCQNQVVNGTACNADGSLCTGPDSCQAGTCTAGPSSDCNDNNSCTDDSCVATSGCVYVWIDGKACNDGNDCSDKDTCKQGKCNGIIKICDDKNPCTADVCLAGACTATAVNGAPCTDSNPCTGADTCALGLCSGLTVTCDDANPCTGDVCDKGGGCTNLPIAATACEDGNLCTSGDLCTQGVCVGGSGVPCASANPCVQALCAAATGDCGQKLRPDGFGCSDGKACTGGDACSKGSCAGKVACDDKNACTADSCDASGACVAAAINGGKCDDGDKCSSGDGCATGQCVGASAPSVCDDNNPCTVDSCGAKTGCAHTNKADASVCDDSLGCNGSDSCKAGQCSEHASACKTCTTDGDCTSEDDGNVCTGKVVCAAKVCSLDSMTVIACDHGADTACAVNTCASKTGSCALVNLADGATCSDGNPCTSADACKAGACAGPSACDDANPCTTDACAATGCTHKAAAGAKCDDGSACTTSDTCASGGTCVGTPTVCSDDNSCTDDSCDAKTGCKTADNSKTCQLTDCKQGQCAAGACIDSGKTGCDDGNPCTTDTCADKACQVAVATDGSLCPDSDACTTKETCTGGKCASQAVDCPDAATACQIETCDASSGCGFALSKDGTSCDDGDACSSGDTCAAGKCSSKPVVCDDTNACTSDSCDGSSGKCAFAVLASGSCDDGNLCTITDVCAKGSCSGSAKICDDGLVCTADACDTKAGGCATPPAADGTPCDDQNGCTENDACKAGTCKGEIAADAVTTLAGSADAGFANGTGSSAKFAEPVALAVDASGTLYVCDAASGSARIRKVTAGGQVTTLAGQGLDGWVDGGPTLARFWRPSGIALANDGNLYVADRFNQRIRKVDSAGTVTTLAGDAAEPGLGDLKAPGDFADGQGTAAKFDEPAGIAWSATDSTLYVVEAANHRVRKVTLNGTVTLVAGKDGGGVSDGDALQATFNAPTGIAVGSDGAIFIADTGNHRIRKLIGGKVTTVAGGGIGYADAALANSLFSDPAGLSWFAGSVFVADSGNGSARNVAISEVKTLAGSGVPGFADGGFAAAKFKGPRGIIAASAGLWYVADSENFRIRKLFSPATACGK
ncbi:MAG: hypothetical protein EXR77_06610 [Myxococcales bacterium]|nr:hypothetical protein [Myxococcales bacterium]